MRDPRPTAPSRRSLLRPAAGALLLTAVAPRRAWAQSPATPITVYKSPT